MAKNDLPRKPLRQRVADRQAGLREAEKKKDEPWRQRVGLAATTAQGISLMLIMYEVYRLIQNDLYGTNWTLVIAYCVVFFVGRATQLAIKFF